MIHTYAFFPRRGAWYPMMFPGDAEAIQHAEQHGGMVQRVVRVADKNFSEQVIWEEQKRG